MNNKVIKNASWMIGCKIAQSVISLIIGMLTARYLGPSNYGLISYAASIAVFLLPLMQLGLSKTLVQEFIKRPDREGEVLGTALVFNIVSAIACMGGMYIFLSIANAGESTTIMVGVLYSFSLLFQATEIVQYWFQAKLLSKYPSIASVIAYTVVALYKIYLLVTGKSVIWFSVSSTLDYLLISFMLLIVYKRMGNQKLSFSWQLGKEMLHSSKYYIVASMMVSVFQQTDRIMLKLMMNEEALRAKVSADEKRYKEINARLQDEAVLADHHQMTALSKEAAQLEGIVEAGRQLKELDAEVDDATAASLEDDPEIKEMAAEQLNEAESRRIELLEHIQHLLLPQDPDDDHNVIMEIRGGVGGDEGNIFAGDLYRMYTRYAETKGWKIEVLESSESEAGGFSQIIFSIKGKNVYKALKFESGAHRVQRVPKTESQGRIQTSTATVLVTAEAQDDDITIDPKDLTIETHRASGAGGQHINKTDSAVRIVHVPTGITVNCQEGRSQIENRETAMRLIKTRVYEELKRRKDEEEGKIRKAKIGSGDRSEKIRTYNYPQNRVTDHRIGFTTNSLDRIMEGKLDELLDALAAADEKRKLEEAAQ